MGPSDADPWRTAAARERINTTIVECELQLLSSHRVLLTSDAACSSDFRRGICRWAT